MTTNNNVLNDLARSTLESITEYFEQDGDVRPIHKITEQINESGYEGISDAEIQRVIDYKTTVATYVALNSEAVELQKKRDLQAALTAQERSYMSQAKLEELTSKLYVPEKVNFDE